jgi:hypothetical protein
MFLYGKHYFTANGLNLDEVKSLLQKSLRRKEVNLACSAANELGHHLTWDKLLTYVFEDHCLISSELLTKIFDRYKQSKTEKTEKELDKNKKVVIDLLLSKCKTSRVAACLPVVAMDREYRKLLSDASGVEPDTSICFVNESRSCINVDRIISCLRQAWKNRDYKCIIAFMKLVTASHDMEKRKLTREGKKCIRMMTKTEKKRLPEGIGQLVLALLYHDTSESEKELSTFLHVTLEISLHVPQAPMRLILFSVVAHLIFLEVILKDNITKKEDLGHLVEWDSVGKIKEMPLWAIDKHTFRGKFGKSTVDEVIKKGFKDKFENDAVLREFHGPRPKSDITDFFIEGVREVRPLLEENPYWERTKEIYTSFPKRQQRTVEMTREYVSYLRRKMPEVFHQNECHNESEKKQMSIETYFPSQVDAKCEQNSQLPTERSMKRKRDGAEEEVKSKKIKIEHSTEDKVKSMKKIEQTEEDEVKSNDILPQQIPSHETIEDFPLLQVPCGAHKCYTRVDLANEIVWKGPMEKAQLTCITAVYKIMKIVFNDIHTVPCIHDGKYIIFPLLKGKNASLLIEKKTIKDCKQGGITVEKNFMTRENLGLLQLHKLTQTDISSLPVSLWFHFIARFIMKVGDSGLYNALTNVERSFVFGVDLDEKRSSCLPECILDILFTKRPRKVLCDSILTKLKKHKHELIQMLNDVRINDERTRQLAQHTPHLFIDEMQKRKSHVVKTLHSLE